MKTHGATHRRVLYGSALIVLGVIVFGYGAVHAFVSAQQNILEEEYGELLALAERESEVQGADVLLRTLTDDTEALGRYGIERDNIVSFIQTIESLGRISGGDIEITTVEVQDISATESELVLSFIAEGGWGTITHLLALTEALPVRKTVQSIGLRNGEDGNWSLSATVQAPLF